MGFEELPLNATLQVNLTRLGYRHPRPIQAQAIGSAIDGRDIIGLAPTGAGKTAAYALAVAQQLIAERGPKPKRRKHRKQRAPRPAPSRAPSALILCPTRELAQQVAAETVELIRRTGLKTVCVFGKVGVTAQAQEIAAGVDILVGTTGRVRELIDADHVSLAAVRHVVIDEADRMLDMGFLPQVRGVLATIENEHQSLLFTATLPPGIEQLIDEQFKKPVRIEVAPHTTVVEHVDQHLIAVRHRDKVPLLLHLLDQPKRSKGVLVFCATRRRVGWVGAALARHGISVGMIHGDRTQAQRQRALDGFMKGELSVVVATDVAARGLHIPTVRTVINYDVPGQAEEYVHRVGRAGHGGGFGESFTFLDRTDHSAWDSIVEVVDLLLPVEEIAGFEPPSEDDLARGDRRDDADRSDRRSKGGRGGGRVFRRHSAKRGSPGRDARPRVGRSAKATGRARA